MKRTTTSAALLSSTCLLRYVTLRYVTLHFCIRDIARTITGCGQAWYSLQPIITWYPPTQRHLPSLPPSGMHSTVSKCSPGQRLLFFKRRWKGVRRQNTPEVSLNFARGLRSDSWNTHLHFCHNLVASEGYLANNDYMDRRSTWDITLDKGAYKTGALILELVKDVKNRSGKGWTKVWPPFCTKYFFRVDRDSQNLKQATNLWQVHDNVTSKQWLVWFTRVVQVLYTCRIWQTRPL